jgi:hypothetical protein
MNVIYFLYYNTFILNIFYIRRGEGSPWHREEAAKGQGCGGHQRGDGGVKHMFGITKEVGEGRWV